MLRYIFEAEESHNQQQSHGMALKVMLRAGSICHSS